MDYLIVTAAVSEPILSAWNECLDAADFATHYTAPEFLTEGYFSQREPFAVLALEGKSIHGVVTGLVEGRDIRCGASGSPHVCVRRGTDLERVGRTLAAGLRAHSSPSIELISAFTWSEIPGLQRAGFRRRSFDAPLCTIFLDLSRGKDWLFRQSSETRRNKIRRALKAGVTVAEMNLEQDFDDYYELYRHWSNFKNLTCQPRELQRLQFGARQNRLVLVARYQGRIIGVSTFRFRRGGLVEYSANVSRREETRFRQNDLLLWRGIEWAVDQGCFKYFSMAGAHFFLQKFGGKIHRTYGYSLDRTILRRRHAVDGLRTLAARAYRALPQQVRQTAKRLLRRSSATD